MTYTYGRLPDPGEGLRLHLNENTAGCSPKVIEALRRMGSEDAAFYPDYEPVTRECGRYFGVAPEQLLLTNGLDEGILAAAVAYLQQPRDAAESIVVEPAFDMYAACSEAAGGRVVPVQPRFDFTFPLSEVLGAISDATRLVFLTNPNNPTGEQIPRGAIRDIARGAPKGAIVFLDEAYADFAGESFLDELDCCPNVVIGRTFAKAHGLAALRVGAVIAASSVLEPMRRVVPPYSLNACAVAALRIALNDTEHVRWYLAEAQQSKQLLYEACERLGLEYWRSAANFVLVRVGDRSDRLVRGLVERRIFIRDRSHEPGCAGCVRITAGVVQHTKACIAAMESVLCGAP